MLDYLTDLEVDFRVFYRIDNMYLMEGASFFPLASRTGAYQGVIRARAESEAAEEAERKNKKPGARRGGEEVQQVSLDKFLQMDGVKGEVEIG